MIKNMIKFAPKIFSNDSFEQQKNVLNLVQKENSSLEVALYGYNLFTNLIEQKINKTEHKILHLWQNKVFLKGFLENENETKKYFNFEASYARRLNIKKSVIHVNKAQTQINLFKKDEIEFFTKSLLHHIDYCYKNEILLHVENTYENIDFFHIMFNVIDKYNFNDIIGFCLDTGHTRALVPSNLNDWLNFIKELNNKKISIHYHIHTNNALADEHLNLSIGHTLGLIEPDVKWCQQGFLNWLKEAIKTTPEAIFCLEHGSDQAFEAMSYINLLRQENFFEEN